MKFEMSSHRSIFSFFSVAEVAENLFPSASSEEKKKAEEVIASCFTDKPQNHKERVADEEGEVVTITLKVTAAMIAAGKKKRSAKEKRRRELQEAADSIRASREAAVDLEEDALRAKRNAPQPPGEGTVWEWLETTGVYCPIMQRAPRHLNRVRIIHRVEATLEDVKALQKLLKRCGYRHSERSGESYYRNADMEWRTDANYDYFDAHFVEEDIKDAVQKLETLSRNDLEWQGDRFRDKRWAYTESAMAWREEVMSAVCKAGDFLENSEEVPKDAEARAEASRFCQERNWDKRKHDGVFEVANS